jgi:hypothetical protein
MRWHCDLLVISDMDVPFCPIAALRWWKDATSLEVKCLYSKNSQGKCWVYNCTSRFMQFVTDKLFLICITGYHKNMTLRSKKDRK